MECYKGDKLAYRTSEERKLVRVADQKNPDKQRLGAVLGCWLLGYVLVSGLR